MMEKAKPTSRLRQPIFSSGGSANKRVKLESCAGSVDNSVNVKSKPSTIRSNSSSSVNTKNTKPLFTVGSTAKSSATQRSSRKGSTTKKLSKSPAKESKPAPTKPAGRPKRAAWDTKGQLGDLREEFEQFKETYRRELADKENQRQQLVVEKTQEIVSVETRLSEQLAELKELKHESEIQVSKLQKDLADSNKNVERLTDENEQMSGEIRLLQKERSLLRLAEKENQFELKEKASAIESLSENISSLEAKLLASEETNRGLEREKREHEMERRKLHNTIQELKGNIRVFARVRPAISSEKDSQGIFNFPDFDHKKMTVTRPANLNESSIMNETLRRTEKFDFAFDKVFEQESSQGEVFAEISQLVQSALDGYNVCIFAYGQTGSGKTYTMQGPDMMTRETEGMIPRSIVQIFASAGQLEDLGWKYKMVASFLEIYNESIKDLLGQPGKDVKHEIKTASGEVIITNMTSIDVTHPQQVGQLFERATRNRRVAETNCNVRSSRSHSVFTLKISGVNTVTSETCFGTLNLVDLAGSERLKESKSEGERLKETQCINTSLSTLGNVIMSLAAKKAHIPYRDSKLTFLLQNSLGGNSKTLMFVNVSPNEEHFNETISSLRFATKVNNCSIGTAKKVAK
ncbi:carboxy-terminal kinesin 2-like [Watersipora subatra]|uniref:carboxy-terminal kinesin 2-like n=1 Tax=Watersipora subatra TaxID=2589382 RepID=UPI00355C73A1